MQQGIDMSLFGKYLDEYIGLIDKTMAKFPESSLNPMLLVFRAKLVSLRVKA